MGITFRHDAAAVALPSVNASGRKYGQQLVLQQQQQKYATQQAQQDRMFDAYKMESQNVAQQQRDWQQRDFVLNRDRDQNKLQQQQMEAARQQQFMEEARKMESGMIMNDIQNGLYDTNTARELQQTLALEAEALGNPQYDATQRAEALQKIRARRALLAANRMEKPPAPTPQEQFDQNIVNRNGVDYIQDSKGKWTPLEPSKARQEQEKMIQQQEQEAQKMRPMSAQDYYSQNEDKFQKDLDATMKGMQAEYDAGTRKEAPTQEAAWEQMQKNHDFRQKALGKAQYGEPTLAPPMPDAATQPQTGKPGIQSINEMVDQPDMSQMENPLPSEYTSPTAPPVAPTQQLTPAQQAYDAQNAAQGGTGRRPYSVPQRTGTEWQDIVSPPTTPQSPATTQTGVVPNDVAPALTEKRDTTPRYSKKTTAPDFGSLASSAAETDRPFISNMQQLYQGQTPEVQSAINVLLDPNAKDEDAAMALSYLRANGIDPESFAKPMTRPNSPRGSKPPKLSSPNSSSSPRAKR